MATYIALLRAVNVGGTGKLPMNDLRLLCEELGFQEVRTYIQSGNVVFKSRRAEKSIRQRLENALADKLGKRIDVVVRTTAELQSVLNGNPFPGAEPAKIGVLFQTEPVDKNLLGDCRTPGGEQIRLGQRELYIHYPHGMGQSKLKLPATNGTVRNMNTVAKLVALATS